MSLDFSPGGNAGAGDERAGTSATTSSSDIIWGAEEIGRVINRNPRQVWHLLDRGEIKCARKVGGRWCASRAALLREFGAGQQIEPSSNLPARG
jgi:hypothetical protein